MEHYSCENTVLYPDSASCRWDCTKEMVTLSIMDKENSDVEFLSSTYLIKERNLLFSLLLFKMTYHPDGY